MYKERAALEKDYATKLSALARKAADRKSKRMASVVVGDEPTVAWGEDTLRRRCVTLRCIERNQLTVSQYFRECI